MTKFQRLIRKYFPKYYHSRYCGCKEYTYPAVAKIDKDKSHRYPLTCVKCGYFRMMPVAFLKRQASGTVTIDYRKLYRCE